MHVGSRNRLNHRHLDRFPTDTLFDRLGRAVCDAECLPRKELFEAWETAKRVRRRFRGGTVVDMAAGHGLLAWVMLLLDDTSPRAICVDPVKPQSFARLARVIEAAWPRLAGRVEFVEESCHSVALPDDSLIVSVHACGALCDRILGRAIEARHRVAVVPCCQSPKTCDTGRLDGWLPSDMAIDVTRAARLTASGFDVLTTAIPSQVTAKNRLLIASPTVHPA